jgi:isocitrate lyase
MRDITAEIKPFVKEIIADAGAGQSDAAKVIQLHRMHCSAPNDPGAYGLCCAAFDDWKKNTDQLEQ